MPRLFRRSYSSTASRRRLGLVALVAGAAAAALAIDYEPIPLNRLIGLAELVVEGRVVAVETAAVRLEIGELLVGESPGREIAVRPFAPWPPGSPRAVPYAVGQAFVLFLVREPGTEAGEPWRILGIGGEGELPVDGSRVYFSDLSVDFVERQIHRVHGVEVESQGFSRDRLLAAVREYPKCFRWWPASAGTRPRPERVCDDATFAEYRLQSRLHEHLADSTLRQIPEP